MVQATVDNASFTILKSKRTHGGTFYKSVNFPIIKLKAHNIDNPSFQESQLLFNPNSTTDYESAYDGDYRLSHTAYILISINGDVSNKKVAQIQLELVNKLLG